MLRSQMGKFYEMSKGCLGLQKAFCEEKGFNEFIVNVLGVSGGWRLVPKSVSCGKVI